MKMLDLWTLLKFVNEVFIQFTFEYFKEVWFCVVRMRTGTPFFKFRFKFRSPSSISSFKFRFKFHSPSSISSSTASFIQVPSIYSDINTNMFNSFHVTGGILWWDKYSKQTSWLWRVSIWLQWEVSLRCHQGGHVMWLERLRRHTRSFPPYPLGRW